MIKIVKNNGRCKHFRGSKHKYLLYTNDFAIGELYAAINLKSIFYYVLAKIKHSYCP